MAPSSDVEWAIAPTRGFTTASRWRSGERRGDRKAETSQIRIDLTRIEGDLQQAKSRLRTLLGEPPDGDIAVTGSIPVLPSADPDEAALQARAIATRPLATEARLEPQAAEQSLALKRNEGGLGEVRLGFDRETEVAGFTETGPNLQFALPVLNHNQGRFSSKSTPRPEPAAAGRGGAADSPGSA
ncbi:MAG: hypothetical protein ACYCW6_28395 [Candidatus Xenobia bacterium]